MHIRFFKLIDVQTIIVTLLAILSTYLCNRFEFYANLASSLIGIAIIFPIVFSINTAYKRREEALKYFASSTEKEADQLGRVYDVFSKYSMILDTDESISMISAYTS